MLKITLIFIWITPWCLAQSWEKPYFSDANVDGIEFGEYVETSKLQYLDVDEEIGNDFTLVKIDYTGNAKPEMAFRLGTSLELNAKLVQHDDGWVIQIKDLIDYEQIINNIFIIQIKIEDVDSSLYIKIINLIDTNPVVTYNGPCIVKELLDANTVIDDCIFTVMDPDGIEPSINNITFVVLGNENVGEQNYFSLKEISKDIAAREIVYHLLLLQTLHYDVRPFYNFRIDFMDIGNNNKSLLTIVEVVDIPNMPPRWTKPFAYQRYNEKTLFDTIITAQDGDTGINADIQFSLSWINENEDYSRFMNIEQIDANSAKLTVKEIDRDAEEQEIFRFIINAYKDNNVTWNTPSDGLIVIDDINDNFPEITIDPARLLIKENTYLTLPIDIFSINDIDLGDHATYTVILSDGTESKIKYSEAFIIIPGSGYQLTDSFQINVISPKLLDYEDDDWRSLEITVNSFETKFPERYRTKTIHIDLENWNDEFPIFQHSEYIANISEIFPNGGFIKQVLAIDRDIGDEVHHFILGNIYEKIVIDKLTGDITTDDENVFDYERQQMVIVQIQATDTLGEPYNNAFAQLTINVIDENDETPTLQLPRKSPSMEENLKDYYEVTNLITAYDPDTTADIKFSINWTESYATKSGQENRNRSLFEDCFLIKTTFDDENDNNNARGVIIVNPDFIYNIDYEEYEVIYLYIMVTDHNQKYNLGIAEGMMTVQIIDLNDCPPEFVDGTLTLPRNVVEEALIGAQIGTILAFDRDGPGNNIITYGIKPINETVPKDWIEIDSETGVLRVANNTIDCDIPIRMDIEYTIFLTDGVHDVDDNIKIDIIDINNKSPEVVPMDSIEVPEKQDVHDVIIGNCIASDKDRDPPHNVLSYEIDYLISPILQKLFKIDEKGNVILIDGTLLDYDTGDKEHDIHIIVKDNLNGNGDRKEAKIIFHIDVTDINDHAPELPEPKDFKPTIMETDKEGTRFSTELCAVDLDSGENGRVSFEIMYIESTTENATTIEIDLDEEGASKNCIYFKTKQDLIGFYGQWKVNIRAYDHGDDDVLGAQEQNETFIFKVIPENLKNPDLLYPNIENIRLMYNKNHNPKDYLTTYEGKQLQAFTAYDPDGEEFGDVAFILSASITQPNDFELFEMKKENRHSSHLMLKKAVDPNSYRIMVHAEDGGGKPSKSVEVNLIFIDEDGEPFFEDTSMDHFEFHENVNGTLEEHCVREAKDPRNEGIPENETRLEPYYFIDAKYNPEDAKLFKLEPQSRVLKVAQELDREKIDTHTFQIMVSRTAEPPAYVEDNAKLIIKITVLDVNDNPPIFEEEEYGIGITTEDHISKILLKVTANDADLIDNTTYTMVHESFETHGENLDTVNSNSFIVNDATGQIVLNFKVQPSMSGYMEFKVRATDLAFHFDETNVKIFIIAEQNRVSFIFFNSKEELEENSKFISDTFEKRYELTCFIDDVTGEAGQYRDSTIQSTVRAHFTRDFQAVDATEIQSISSDAVFITNLKSDLSVNKLTLHDIPGKLSIDEKQNMAEVLQIVLIVVSVLLGFLCIVLTIAFFIRTNNLKRQLKAFKTVDFGSTSSELNRQAPTTNVFSYEGANPVLNNSDIPKDVFDNVSTHSDASSDFNDVINDPTFMPRDQKGSFNPMVGEDVRRRSMNPMGNTTT